MSRIICLNCGSEDFEYYESGDYLIKKDVAYGVVSSKGSEPDLNENNSGLICTDCQTDFDIEFEKDLITIKKIYKK